MLQVGLHHIAGVSLGPPPGLHHPVGDCTAVEVEVAEVGAPNLESSAPVQHGQQCLLLLPPHVEVSIHPVVPAVIRPG